MHGSVQLFGGKGLHSDYTVAGVRYISPLTLGQATRAPRNPAQSYETGRRFNDTVTFCTGFFTSSVRITFRAGLTSSSCSVRTFPR